MSAWRRLRRPTLAPASFAGRLPGRSGIVAANAASSGEWSPAKAVLGAAEFALRSLKRPSPHLISPEEKARGGSLASVSAIHGPRRDLSASSSPATRSASLRSGPTHFEPGFLGACEPGADLLSAACSFPAVAETATPPSASGDRQDGEECRNAETFRSSSLFSARLGYC